LTPQRHPRRQRAGRQGGEQFEARSCRNAREVLTRSREENVEPRRAAGALARERVLAAMAYRRRC
jgi:hypothetical protein